MEKILFDLAFVIDVFGSLRLVFGLNESLVRSDFLFVGFGIKKFGDFLIQGHFFQTAYHF
jgi:hypothetical protein